MSGKTPKPVSSEEWRKGTFKVKFATAAKELGAPSEHLISLKLRENIGNYHEYKDEYKELLDVLRREVGLSHSPVAGNLQGNGHLIGNAKAKVIVVEHETGLEILYIAGSVASIIGLVPVVLQFWRAIRSHSHRRLDPGLETLEIRRMDSAGRLVEERDHRGGLPWFGPLDITTQSLLSKASNIDEEMQNLKTDVKRLKSRLNAVEKKLAGKKPRRQPQARKVKKLKK